MHIIANSILPGDLVFDIGAHRGDKAAWFVELGARVVCVEPQPALVPVLKERFADNSEVYIIPKGLASKAGTMEMSINTREPVLSTFSDQWKSGRFSEKTWDQVVQVEVTTFDDLVREFGVPRYAKVDVEGFEPEVIRGLTSKIGCISFEYAGEFLINAGDVLCYLSGLGYSKFNYSIGEQDSFALEDWADRKSVSAKLAATAMRNPRCWGDIYAI